MRIVVRTSRLAIWSRRLGSFSVVLLLLSIILHFSGQIAPDVFEISIGLASVFAALALLLAVLAFAVLWQTGDKGWGLALSGFIASSFALIPAGTAFALYFSYPSTLDVSTDIGNPPALALAHPDRPEHAVDPEALANRFPNLVSRSYQLPVEVMHNLVEALARNNGWTVLRSRAPTETGMIGTLNARRETLWGWSSEIAIRVAANPMGANVSIRAASLRDMWHDLGDNGRSLENALLALDDAVTLYVRDGLAILDDDDEEELPEALPEDHEAL